jgi:hypothetical protein
MRRSRYKQALINYNMSSTGGCPSVMFAEMPAGNRDGRVGGSRRAPDCHTREIPSASSRSPDQSDNRAAWSDMREC